MGAVPDCTADDIITLCSILHKPEMVEKLTFLLFFFFFKATYQLNNLSQYFKMENQSFEKYRTSLVGRL